MPELLIALGTLCLLLLVGALWLLRERFRLTAARDLYRARSEDLVRTDERMAETFEALSAKALRSSSDEFLKLARETLAAREARTLAEMDRRKTAVDEMVRPIRETLRKTQEEIRKIERGHAGIRVHVEEMTKANRDLSRETGRLREALTKPNVRGRYGEIQLERVVELAGMRSYCDFTTQQGLRDQDDRLYKPDMVVRLPNERVIAIDAKTSLDAYIQALDAETPEQADALLDRYAENVFEQAQKLAKKEYWAHLEQSPEFVVMFIPGDQLVDAALERRPELIEFVAERGIVIASPSTLIGLLRAVHVGWREKNLSEQALELFQLGRELHERAAVALVHASKVGEAISTAKECYNRFVGSIDSRLVPTLRKFEESGARSSKTLTRLAPVEGEVRTIQSLEDEDMILPALGAQQLEGSAPVDTDRSST